MKIVSYRDRNFAELAASLKRSPVPSSKVVATVREFIQAVRSGGDDALVEITNRFSPVKISKMDLRLRKKAKLPPRNVVESLNYSLDNIASFSGKRVPKAWRSKNKEGAVVGENFHPLQRVGIYVPGGTAPLVSTALMTVALAKVAGVPEIVVCTPPAVGNDLLYAIQLAGATEVYQVGGAQAVGALAYGTLTIARVQKILGPGNAYVVEAKRQVFGDVGIDLLPGPSEIAVLADVTSNFKHVASDLLAQAEHGPGSQIYLLTSEEGVIDAVQTEIRKQLKSLDRQHYLQETLTKGAWFIRARNVKQAVALIEDIAPEHLYLDCKDAKKLSATIRNCGAVFIGKFSPVAAGDYLAGPSHTLPTGGAGRAFSGLTVDQFMRRTSVVEYSKGALKKACPHLETLAALEGMTAHAASARIRIS